MYHSKNNSDQKPVNSTSDYQEKFKSANKSEIERLDEVKVPHKVSQTPKTKESKRFDFSSSDTIDKKINCINLTTKHTRVDSKSSKSKYFEGSNEYNIMVYNSTQVTPSSNSKLSWNETFVISCSQAAEFKTKLFSISLIEHEKNESRIVGGERTFSVDQFDSTKIYDLNVEFKRNFKAETQAKISIKLQYINNYIEMVNSAICNLREEQEKCNSLCNEIKLRLKTLKSNPLIDLNAAQNGGWYDTGSSFVNKESRQKKKCTDNENIDCFQHNSERTKSCQAIRSNNKQSIHCQDVKSISCNRMTDSFLNNCDSAILNSSALYGSIADEIDDRSSILIKENDESRVEPGSYLNFVPR